MGRFRNVYLEIAAILAIMSLTLSFSSQAKEQTSGPPPTRRDDVVDVLHGVRISDPYRWLEDQNSPETRSWIEAQNSYTHSIIDRLPGRDHLSARLGQLMKIDNIEVPVERNGRYFFRERRADQDLFVIHMKQGAEGKDEVLIDPHPMSPDHTTSVTILDVTEDGNVLAYGVRRGGADEMEVHLMDVSQRRDLSDQLPKARYFGVSFKPDKSGLYYSMMGEDAPHVRYHALGTDAKQDAEIFGKGYGPQNIAVADVSEDGRYLVIQVLYGAAADKTDIFYQDLSKKAPIEPLVRDIDARFQANIGGDKIFLQTNWKAPNGRILAVDLHDPARERWREIVPETNSVMESFALAGGKLLVRYLHDVTSQVKVFGADGRPAGEVNFPTLGTVSEISGHWQGDEAFFGFSSFHVPLTIYRYALSSSSKSEWARLKVPLESENFELKQVWYESKDKTRVPMFLLHKKGLKLDGSNPTLMTAYGGFNVSYTPQFSATAVLWAEHGGVFAVPNLRGGGEFGEKWHRAGMQANKQNVFDDFLSAAQWLISNRYTNSSKLAIEGRSNGGLLMGAAITQRPDLFKAVICGYPLLDMLRYQDFLVAKFWVPEYGSAADPEQFKYIYAYSPYQHVEKTTKYPAIMFVSGDFDTRVAPLHARKMAALMQWATAGSSNPVLLHYDTKAGHSEGRPVNKQIEDVTDELSFLMWQLGMKP
ncbi:MAG TPA: prolyl oligopeptidase family serine peptidase [Terriglobales bacterium]|nr:prolyl oligopeptidase family serine peptidase [Terriglobales bacterium]